MMLWHGMVSQREHYNDPSQAKPRVPVLVFVLVVTRILFASGSIDACQ